MRPACIGHGGASALAPANTLRSFALAVELGADMLELDVRGWRGRLVLAHTILDAAGGRCLELDPALAWLRASTPDEIRIVVDLKSPGTEDAVLAALRRHRLTERSLLTSQCRSILRRVHALEPAARTGISVAGRVSRRIQRWSEWRDEVLAELTAGRHAALMVHRRLADAQLVERVGATGAQLHAWTVRAAADAHALTRLGVDGIVTPDPRLLRAG